MRTNNLRRTSSPLLVFVAGFLFVGQKKKQETESEMLFRSNNTTMNDDTFSGWGSKGQQDVVRFSVAASDTSSTCSIALTKTGAVVMATPNDIIVGSRGTHHSGPGNERFNRLIDSYIPKYNRASTKADKGQLFEEVLKACHDFGRFLCHNPKTKTYHELGEYAAKEKISHALRYRRKRMMTMKKKAQSNVPPQGTASLGKLLLAADRQVRCLSQIHFTTAPTTRQEAKGTSEGLFSDEDMDSVLGRPGEYDWSSLSKP